jgi:hypothetical protein
MSRSCISAPTFCQLLRPSASCFNFPNIPDLPQRSSTFRLARFPRFHFRYSSSFCQLSRRFASFCQLPRHSSTFADLLWRSNSPDSIEFFFDISELLRAFRTLPELIITDSTFLELSQLSNSRDSGDLLASAVWVLHRVSGISSSAPGWSVRAMIEAEREKRRGEEEKGVRASRHQGE